MLETTLSIVGAFIALGLAINAYFIKGLLDSINDIKISTALNSKDYFTLDVRVKNVENAVGDIYKKIWHLENKDKHL